MGTFRTLILALGGALLASEAGAVVPQAVALDARCTPPGVEPATVLTILEAEVAPARARLVDPWTPITATETGLVLDECTDARATVAVTVTHEGGANARFLDLEDVSLDARSRTLALAMAEALRGAAAAPSAPTLRADAQPTAAVTPPPASGALVSLLHVPRPPTTDRSDDVAAPPGAERYFGFRGGPTLRLIPKTASLLVGVTAAGTWGPLGVGVLAMGSERDSDLGRLRVVAVALTVSAEQALFTDIAGVRIEGELGGALATGKPRAGVIAEDQQSVHAGLSASAWARLPVVDGWTVEPSLGGGYARSELGNAGNESLGSHGWFTSASVAARY